MRSWVGLGSVWGRFGMFWGCAMFWIYVSNIFRVPGAERIRCLKIVFSGLFGGIVGGIWHYFGLIWGGLRG